MGAGCDHIAHVNTQLMYALPVAGISIFACLIPTALGLPVFVSLLVGLAAVVGLIFLFGKDPGKALKK
jgi:Na+/H+ antiporter NhaC